MKGACCRSTPRCARCPVIAAAVARRPQDPGSAAALVTAVLAGPRPPLPRCVESALAGLDEARASGRRFAPERELAEGADRQRRRHGDDESAEQSRRTGRAVATAIR